MLEQVLLRSLGGETAYFLQLYKSDVATKLLQCGFEGFFCLSVVYGCRVHISMLRNQESSN